MFSMYFAIYALLSLPNTAIQTIMAATFTCPKK